MAKPKRRKFTAQYRLRILEEAESCTQPGEVGRLLRREGLYSSHLTEWRRARREGSLQGLTPSKRGRKLAERNPLSAKVHELEAKVARLEKELHTAHTILDVQGKVAGLLGLRRDNQLETQRQSGYWLDPFWWHVRKEAGLEDLRLHDTRHSYASMALLSGETIRAVGRLLGHEKAATTLKYAHLRRDNQLETQRQSG